MQGLDSHLIGSLDAKALKQALDIQIPLKEHLGTIRSAILGMHVYLFGVTQNTAHIDRLITQITHLQAEWHPGLTSLIHQCADLRISDPVKTDLNEVYIREAESILTLAADLIELVSEAKLNAVERYQIYACDLLLGAKNRPAFFKREKILDLIDPNTRLASAVFMRQFSQRLRKPELIRRELERFYAPLEQATPEIQLHFLEGDTTP